MKMTGPTTLTLIQHLNGCAAWRVVYPAAALHAEGYPVAWGYVGEDASAAQTEFAQLVVLQRASWQPGDERLAEQYRDWLHAGGRALGYEIDDDLYSSAIIERLRLTGDAAIEAKSDATLEDERQARIFALQLADGVTVSTEGLARVVRRLTPAPVTVIPNAIDVVRFRQSILDGPQRRLDQPLTIGWVGGNRPDRDADLTGLAEAWRRIAKRWIDVRFVVGGYPLGTLLKAVPEWQCQYIDKVPLKHYGSTYAMVDIACCPLASETFNESKSFIKALEFAVAGAVVCASPLVYGDLIEDGRNGYLCRDAEDWEAALLDLMFMDGEARRAMADRLLADVLAHHTLDRTVARWPEAWSQTVRAAGTFTSTPDPEPAVRAADARDERDPQPLTAGGGDA